MPKSSTSEEKGLGDEQVVTDMKAEVKLCDVSPEPQRNWLSYTRLWLALDQRVGFLDLMMPFVENHEKTCNNRFNPAI